MKPFIIYVSGAPGSGKTTLAKQLSRQLNIHHISSDLVHGSGAFLNPSHDRGETIRDVFIPYLVNTARLGISFVVDHVLQKDIAKKQLSTSSCHMRMSYTFILRQPIRFHDTKRILKITILRRCRVGKIS